MTNKSLPQQLDSIILRLKNKCEADSYTALVDYFSNLNRVTWYNLPKQQNDIVKGIVLYQTEAVDGDLQDAIDQLTSVYWFNIYLTAKRIETATKLIEEI